MRSPDATTTRSSRPRTSVRHRLGRLAAGAAICLPALATGLATGPTAGAVGGTTVTVTPGLSPAFRSDIEDYVVHCTGAPTVSFSASVPGGTTLSVAGSPAQTGAVSATLPLVAGQRFTWTIANGATTSTYSARCLPSDFPTWTTTESGTPQTKYFMFSPLSFATVQTFGYVILADVHGTPVWWYRLDGSVPTDGRVMSDGTLAWFDTDHYTRRTLDGTEVVRLGSNLDGHELVQTAAGTYLAMRYLDGHCPAVPSECVDTSSWGGTVQANPINAQIVELDAAGHDLWTWNSQDHLALSEASEFFALNPPASPTGFAGANDIIHMNSIEPDPTTAAGWPSAGFMITARHLDAIYHVSRATGAIDWKLGGTHTAQSLTVTNPPAGTPLMSGLHDVRYLPDGTITVHDNGTGTSHGPRAMRFSLDLVNRTATLVETVDDQVRVPGSVCCGSSRKLSGGHWATVWGGSPVMTELTAAGSPVFTIQLPPAWTSYRMFPVMPGQLDPTAMRRGMDAMAPPVGFHPVKPTRVFDTRDGSGLRTVATHKVAGGTELTVQLSDMPGYTPASGISAVALNVTTTDPDNDGWLQVAPCGTPHTTSNLNYQAGQTVPNMVITPIATNGTACFFTTATTHLLADINGWFGAQI